MHRKTKDIRRLWTAIDEVTQEHEPATFRMRGSMGICIDLPAELPHELDEFVEASVHVPDKVEGPLLRPTIGPCRLPRDLDRCDLLSGVEYVDPAEPLPLQASQ
jgi:hypothetical protein